MPQTFVFPRCRPETVGISPSSISAFLQEADSGRIGLHSFMLLRHGQVAAEAWWAPYDRELPHMLFSMSKSFVSTAIGFAVEEGRLSVDDQVLSFFPEREASADDNWKKMRIRHLLSMSTGHTEETVRRLWPLRDRDWVRTCLDMPVERELGTHFVYNGSASYLLSAIIQSVTGMTLLDYLTPRLFDPLGIRGAAWDSCPRGINIGGSGLRLKTEDIARFRRTNS